MTLTDEEFLSKLKAHPSLKNRFEQLLTIIDNPDGRSNLADDAEMLVTTELRSLGNEMLSEWAKNEHTRCEETLLKENVSVKKKSKKNSTGTPPMVT
jgi:hypothetical protein